MKSQTKVNKSAIVASRIDTFTYENLRKAAEADDRTESYYIRQAIKEKLQRDGYGSLYVFPGVVYDDTNVCKPDHRTGTFADSPKSE
jgi:hypothetical protein